MTQRQTKLVLLALVCVVLIGAVVWSIWNPTPAVAPEIPEDTTTADIPEMGKQVRADVYVCDNGKEFQLQYDAKNNVAYSDSSMAGASDPLTLVSEMSGTKYENDILMITLQDSNASLEYKDMEVSTLCELKNFNEGGIPRSAEGDNAGEATMFGDVLVDGTAQEATLPAGSMVTVKLVARDEEGALETMAETTFASTKLPVQFTIPESEIKMTSSSSEAFFMAEVRDGSDQLLYMTTEDVPLMQESDALAIPVKKQ